MNEPKRNLWSVSEAAKYLNMSTSWLYKRVAAGDIPHCKFGTTVRFVPDQVERYAEQMNTTTSSNVVPIRRRRR